MWDHNNTPPFEEPTSSLVTAMLVTIECSQMDNMAKEIVKANGYSNGEMSVALAATSIGFKEDNSCCKELLQGAASVWLQG
ncbi:hypothetical protein Tco_1231621 [Tanacetum coccineum]